jgi:hypothetical protein
LRSPAPLPYPGVVDKYCTKIGGKKIYFSVLSSIIAELCYITVLKDSICYERMCHIFCKAHCGILITAVILLDLEMSGAAILKLELLVSFVLGKTLFRFWKSRLMNNKRLKRD